MLVNGLLIEEELSTGKGTAQEIASSDCDPLEDRVSGSSLQNEQGNDLLNEETDDNRRPNKGVSLRPQKTGICKLTREHASCVQKKYTGSPGRRRDRGWRWHGHRSQSPFGIRGQGTIHTLRGKKAHRWQRKPERRAKYNGEKNGPAKRKAN